MNNIYLHDEKIEVYERQALGAYISGGKPGNGISAAMFNNTNHAKIYTKLMSMWQRRIKPNIKLLCTELPEVDDAVIAALTNFSNTANIPCCEGEIQKAYTGRQTWAAVTKAKERLEQGGDSGDVKAELQKSLQDRTPVGKRTSRITFQELLTKQFPPQQFFIEKLLTRGLTVFSGNSKSGKSWMCLQAVGALDNGGYFLGSLKAEKVTALYFSLEDGAEAVFHRLKKQGNTEFSGSWLETEKMSFPELSELMDAAPDIKVVIIDTYQKFAHIADNNDYSLNVETASRLKDIADRHSAAIIVVCHLRKNGTEGGDHMSETLGSVGLVSTADCTWTMRRKRGNNEARLFCSGRNIEDQEFVLRWDRDIASWSITEGGKMEAAIPEGQQQVLDILASEPRDWTTAEISERAGKSKSATSNLLKRLVDGGQIESPTYGNYRQKPV
jgi:hypothetical protein